MRIPIHEIAGMSYIRDDDEHILAIKKGISILLKLNCCVFVCVCVYVCLSGLY